MDVAAVAARLGIEASHLARRLEELGVAASPYAEDVALAFACAAQSRPALGELERLFTSDLAGALSRVGLRSRAEIDEVGQIVRERLLVARPDRAPKILDYAGRGPLLGWLRAVIVRTGIDLRRQRMQTSDDDEPLLDATAASDDPATEALRVRYADAFRLAFVDAVRALPADERNALRLNVVDGLNIEQIGNLFGVHRATVARWIARARESIAETTRSLLRERLHLHEGEVESLVRLCRSRIEIGPSILIDDP